MTSLMTSQVHPGFPGDINTPSPGVTDLLYATELARRGTVRAVLVSTIGLAFFPKDMKLTLTHAIANPVKTHIDCFRSFLFDCVGGDSAGFVVVGDHRCGWLRMPHFFEGDTERTRFLAIVEQGAEFGLGCT
jgi:hypothetical protein